MMQKMKKDKFIGIWVKPYNNSLKVQVGRWHPHDMKIIAEDIVQKLKIDGEDIILDLCCGNGLITKIIAENCNEVHGVDFSEILINTAKVKESAPNIYYYVENALNIDKLFPEDFFDKVYCYFSLQHINHRDARRLIGRLSKVTKPKGAILMGDIPDKRKKWKVWYNTWRKRVGYLRQHVYREISRQEGEDSFGWWYHPNQIRKICKELNLKCEILEQNKKLPHAHYRFDVIISKNRKSYRVMSIH